MIIYENKGYETRSDMPNADWTGEALYVIPDSSNLANKIQNLYPYYNFVLDLEGNLIDVVETERPELEKTPTSEERIEALEAAVQMLCMEDVK